MDENILNTYLRDLKFIVVADTSTGKPIEIYFDFHLPEKNLLIEFDGKQHFNSIKYFGGEEGFKKTKANDEIKNCFAKENNINLLRIRYDEINHIEEILNKYI